MQRNCRVPRVEMPLLYQAVEDLMITVLDVIVMFGYKNRPIFPTFFDTLSPPSQHRYSARFQVAIAQQIQQLGMQQQYHQVEPPTE